MVVVLRCLIRLARRWRGFGKVGLDAYATSLALPHQGINSHPVI